MLQITNTKSAKKSARALEKFLAKAGIDLEHGKALEAMAVLAGFKDWNSMAYALSPEGIDKLIDDFERSHIEYNDDVSYGAENALVAHTGFELRYSAEAEMVDYVRVCDPLGREVAYWVSDEWEEDPQLVMGAIIGALVRGRPVEYSDKNKRTVPVSNMQAPVVRIQAVPLSYASNVLVNGIPYQVQFREDDVLAKLSKPAGDVDTEDAEVALRLFRTEDYQELEEQVTLLQLRQLKWNPSLECFVSPQGETFEFFIEHKFKPNWDEPKQMACVPEEHVSKQAPTTPPSKVDVRLYEVAVFADGPANGHQLGVWAGAAKSKTEAEELASAALWRPVLCCEGFSLRVVASVADEAQYGPFRVYVDDELKLEAAYFSQAVRKARVEQGSGNVVAVESASGDTLYQVNQSK